jgi:hypothetical protein
MEKHKVCCIICRESFEEDTDAFDEYEYFRTCPICRFKYIE